jgi:hypothetical protein
MYQLQVKTNNHVTQQDLILAPKALSSAVPAVFLMLSQVSHQVIHLNCYTTDIIYDRTERTDILC